MTTRTWTKTEIQQLPTHDLRVIVRSTNPDGDLKWELTWAREELERRDAKHAAWKVRTHRDNFHSRIGS